MALLKAMKSFWPFQISTKARISVWKHGGSTKANGRVQKLMLPGRDGNVLLPIHDSTDSPLEETSYHRSRPVICHLLGTITPLSLSRRRMQRHRRYYYHRNKSTMIPHCKKVDKTRESQIHQFTRTECAIRELIFIGSQFRNPRRASELGPLLFGRLWS